MNAAADELTEPVDCVCRALGIDPASVAALIALGSDPPPFPPAVMRELESGHIIQAMKQYREWKGCCLRDAIEAIDGYAGSWRVLSTDVRYVTLKAKLDAILATVASHERKEPPVNIFDLFNTDASPDAAHRPGNAARSALDELTERVDRICAVVGVDTSAIAVHAGDTLPFPPEVMREIKRGNKVGAIKEYREWTNASLKEAKDAIDGYEMGRVQTADSRYAALKAKLDAILAKVEAGR